jgi:peroxiredoxin
LESYSVITDKTYKRKNTAVKFIKDATLEIVSLENKFTPCCEVSTLTQNSEYTYRTAASNVNTEALSAICWQ